MVKCRMIQNARIYYEGEYQNISVGVIIEVDKDYFSELEAMDIVERV